MGEVKSRPEKDSPDNSQLRDPNLVGLSYRRREAESKCQALG